MQVIYFAGRGLQVLGMWLLLVDIFTAGPTGPAFNLFTIGVGLFLVGWLLVRTPAKVGSEKPGSRSPKPEVSQK